jgi:hypothetical protein
MSEGGGGPGGAGRLGARRGGAARCLGLLEGPLSLLAVLEGPVGILAHVLDGLSAAEVVRLCLLTSKRLSEHVADKPLWTLQVLTRLRAFLPASAFFKGPLNASCNALASRRMTQIFRGAAAAADDKLAQVVAHAGRAASGAVWTHDNQDIIGETDGSSAKFAELLANTVVVPGRSQLPDFAKFAAAFACDVCGLGSAERQCAACRALLCAECAVRCAVDHLDDYNRQRRVRDEPALALLPAPLCAFAVCGECLAGLQDEDGRLETLSRQDVLNELLGEDSEEEEVPRLYELVCGECRGTRSLLCCAAHVNLCYLECSKCERGACVTHSYGGWHAPGRARVPDIRNCSECDWTVCSRHRCNATGRHVLQCCSCGSCACSDCKPDGRCRCGHVMSHLYDSDSDHGASSDDG